MRLSIHLVGYAVILIVCAVAVFGLMRSIDPTGSPGWTIVIFYLLSFSTTYCFLTILGFGARRLFWAKVPAGELWRNSRQQAFLVAIMAISALLLSAHDLLSLATAGLLLTIFMLIELYAFAR